MKFRFIRFYQPLVFVSLFECVNLCHEFTIACQKSYPLFFDIFLWFVRLFLRNHDFMTFGGFVCLQLLQILIIPKPSQNLSNTQNSLFFSRFSCVFDLKSSCVIQNYSSKIYDWQFVYIFSQNHSNLSWHSNRHKFVYGFCPYVFMCTYAKH
jgi:hypothetical protein